MTRQHGDDIVSSFRMSKDATYDLAIYADFMGMSKRQALETLILDGTSHLWRYNRDASEMRDMLKKHWSRKDEDNE